MSSDEEIRRYAQILFGLILTNEEALDALRRVQLDDAEGLAGALKQFAGIDVPVEEARKIVDETNELICNVSEGVGESFKVDYRIVN